MTAWRMQFLSLSILIFAGIYLTGFENVHWLLYLPAAGLLLAGITGICPGHLLWKKFGFKD